MPWWPADNLRFHHDILRRAQEQSGQAAYLWEIRGWLVHGVRAAISKTSLLAKAEFVT
jgi:hypothetical protein